jgi:hypothetical protein
VGTKYQTVQPAAKIQKIASLPLHRLVQVTNVSITSEMLAVADSYVISAVPSKP